MNTNCHRRKKGGKRRSCGRRYSKLLGFLLPVSC